MSRLLMVFFVFVLMSGFVVAVESEVTTNFFVNDPAVDGDVGSVATLSFWDSYGGQLIAVAVLAVIYILFRLSVMKKVKKRK